MPKSPINGGADNPVKTRTCLRSWRPLTGISIAGHNILRRESTGDTTRQAKARSSPFFFFFFVAFSPISHPQFPLHTCILTLGMSLWRMPSDYLLPTQLKCAPNHSVNDNFTNFSNHINIFALE
jgi:hypothetical protein